MKDIVMKVGAADSGWRLSCDLPVEPTYFRSGARAEQSARDLAQRLCGAGLDVRVVIEDRARQVVAIQSYFAP